MVGTAPAEHRITIFTANHGDGDLLDPYQPRCDGNVFLVRTAQPSNVVRPRAAMNGHGGRKGALNGNGAAAPHKQQSDGSDLVPLHADEHGHYFDTPILSVVGHRLPWLLVLMLVQSVSGYVVSRYEALIQEHVIIASFLTMLVGGGGNSSGQTVAELVKRLRTKEVTLRDFWRVLAKESATGLLLSAGLGLAAFPRVRYMHRGATTSDAFAIALSYTLIIVMANSLGVCITMLLHVFGKAAVGSPPVTQVLVDVIGISLTCLVCSALLQGA
mmetsp:Transcript_672/g.2046  ORF Transcript_672/g.2046 Transcript_672/m.2046 type:complete len:272 (-) Transcript_672:140-955(-)